MGLEALAAKWRVDPADAAYDDAPTHESMRESAKPMQRRAPSADQKRVRREMARGQHLPKSASETHVDDRGRTHDICGECFRPIHDSAGIDPNVPWVHEDSGNSKCEVRQPSDATMLQGVEMPEATPLYSTDHRIPWHYEGSRTASTDPGANYICKGCGAASPDGIGYAAYGQEHFSDPEPGCPGPHRGDNVLQNDAFNGPDYSQEDLFAVMHYRPRLAYTSSDFGKTVMDEFDKHHPSPAKSWNIADQTERGDGSGDAGGTSVSQSMSDSSVSGGEGASGSGAGGGSTASRLTPLSAYHHATRNQIGVANSMGQILLKGGDQIRMPTGQAVTIKNVRRHETSRDHYYVDTDMGTSLVPWSTQFDVVKGGQQQVLPGPGVSGGNFGDMPNLSGNVEQQGTSHQQQNVSNPTDCPSCKTKGSLVRRGGKFQCNQCGFTQNPQGGGGPGTNFSDATQQYISKINDPRSAIARRCAAVLAFPDPEPDPNPKESL